MFSACGEDGRGDHRVRPGPAGFVYLLPPDDDATKEDTARHTIPLCYKLRRYEKDPHESSDERFWQQVLR